MALVREPVARRTWLGRRVAVAVLLGVIALARVGFAVDANRFAYLDDFSNPFYPSHQFPKLITPQWIGEPGIEAVITYGIDDMRATAPYEGYLRPILDRLKQIDGRAPVSIFANAPNPADPRLSNWLREGLSIEVHTLSHPCPILGQGGFTASQNTFHGCVDLLNRIPGNIPVAFRTPCCDSINSASPRLFAELFCRTNAAGQFLRLDSSVTLLFTTNDPALHRRLLIDAQGRERFRKYVPFDAFSTIIENYPYPYVHSRLCWEMPFVAPSDWQSQHLQGNAHPQLLEDWQAALDLVVLKQGAFNFVCHPAQWSHPTQHVAFIDYATATYGSQIQFLNYREVDERLTRHLLAGQPLRAAHGGDNGIRLLDLDQDGYLDVLIGNQNLQRTRLWDPTLRQWLDLPFPVPLAHPGGDAGARFGILEPEGEPVLLVRNETVAGAWRFRNRHWIPEPEFLHGLELEGELVFTSHEGSDRGVRLRDLDHDGRCELLVANPHQNAVFEWQPAVRSWKRRSYAFPEGVTIVNVRGEDNGLRFLDLNGDQLEDILFSNEDAYSIHLLIPELVLGFRPGWTREIIRGRRDQLPEVPSVVRGGPARNNGVWFTQSSMFMQNEDTARQPNLVVRHAFADLLTGLMPSALSPTQSLANIQVPTHFVVELVAHEPMLRDPVYFDWSEDGRLWVVEMRDYPLGLDGRGKAGGAIRVLEDADADGRYEKSTVFAESLNFPNGLLPWNQGVLVSAAPDLLYLADTNGDNKADLTEKLFTGFGQGNQQHRVNGFDYGLDNWIYGANGDSGGQISPVPSAFPKPFAVPAPVNLSGRDFRFRIDGRFEAVEGQTQFGRHRDDWGDWFGNANPVWLWHYWLPERYLRRNSRLAAERLRRETATEPGASRVYSVGRKQQRLNDVGDAGHVTAANSPTPYRDELFGDAFARAVFISDPVYNLVRCELLEPDGVSFRSRRWNAAEPREFLASTDPWFRPTGLKIGPDGALYIADMYRQYIEHPEWIPKDIKSRYNMRAGDDRGRLYRVYPRDASLRPTPRLGSLATSNLVAALDHPNGWQRDTVQRLLVSRQDPTAIGPLRQLLATSPHPKSRLSALGTLDGLNGLRLADLTRIFRDPHPALREHAIRISEPVLRELDRTPSTQSDPELAHFLEALLALAADPELRVRYQLAFSLGEWDDPRAVQTLARLATSDSDQRPVQIAIASSASRHSAELLEHLLDPPDAAARIEPLLRDLMDLIAATASPDTVTRFLRPLTAAAGRDGSLTPWEVTLVGDWLSAFEKARSSMEAFPEVSALLPQLAGAARQLATDPGLSIDRRLAALPILGRSPASHTEDIRALASLLVSSSPESLQQSALKRLAQIRSESATETLLRDWTQFRPALRAQVLEIVLRHPKGAAVLLDRLGTGAVAPADLGPVVRQQLLALSSESLRARARELLGKPSPISRQQLVEDYLPLVRGAVGNSSHGAERFAQQCAPCHRVGNEGSGAGPDLASLPDRSPEPMLIAILDPNRAVEDKYLSHSIRTKAGDEYSGILVAETANHITLVSASGIRESFLRADLATFTRTRTSLMPEGFEQSLQPQDISDLLAFIQSSARPPRSFPGNQPALIQPQPNNGVLHLLAAKAEIHGDGIAFESPFRNLGMWNGSDARAVWTVEIPAGAAYDVWLHWACQDEEAGDAFQFHIAGQTIRGKVGGTGTWENYRQTQIGRVELPAGRHRAWFQADGALKGYLIDLLEIRFQPAPKR